MMKATRAWTFAVLAALMMAAPIATSWSEQAREDYTVHHISTFSDGKYEKVISFTGPGTDRSLAISLPNGATVISARFNLTGLPTADGGTDYPSNITVDVGSDGSLEYSFLGTGYGAKGHQTLFSNGARILNVSLPTGGGTNSTPSIRLPWGANITSAKMDVKGGGGRVLLIYADKDSNSVNDIVSKLKAFGDFVVVDKFDGNTGTPTLDQLKAYTSCLVYCMGYTGMSGYSSWANYAGMGDVLADYVDWGGGVVTANLVPCSYSYGGITGRFLNNGYYATPSPMSLYGGSNVAIQSVLVPNHPIMQGVNSITYSGSSSLLYLGPTTSPASGAQTVFTWNSGPTVGACVRTMPNGVNRVDIQMNPWSSSVAYRSSYGQGYSGEGDILLRNSLVWTGGAGFGNYSVDFARNGDTDWTNPAMNGTETVNDFSPDLNAYLATALPNGTDAYGNEYVDVPIAISSNASGRLTLLNMSIIYQSTSTVGSNPTTGDLASSLNALLPAKYDMKNTNIPISIYSNHAGKLRLSNLYIEYTPPVHPAIITSRTPEDTVVVMDENASTEFCMTARDPYDYPMNTSWTLNGRTMSRNTFNFTWFADFDANGTYNVTVSVDNTLQKVATSWQVIVRNVNRKPVIDAFSPDKKFEMDENSSATFEMSASDPDGNPMTVTWYLDGKRVLSDEVMYEYKTTYASAGKHEIKVTVADNLQGSTTFIWEVTVRDVNAGPVIADSSPPGDTVTMPENSSRKFGVVDISPDLDKQYITWFLDGTNTGITGRSYNYSADFNSAGNHVVWAQVTDGRLFENRTWTVTVTDVNRPPVAKISSPAPKAEFMLGTEISFDGSTSSDPDGDALTLSWSEAGKPLGTGNTVSAKLTKGKHTIMLSVDDGRTGTATAQVEIYVRYLDFKGTVTVDRLAPVEGQKLIIKSTLTNRGDGSVDELEVSFKVDGTEVSSSTIETVEPDSEFPLEFPWTAVKGDHKLDVTVNNQTFTKSITVAKKPAPAGPAGWDMTMILVAVAVIAIVAVAVGAVFMMSRRKQAAPPQYDSGYQDQRMEEPYEQIEPQPTPAPQPEPRAGHLATAAQPVDQQAPPAMTEEQRALEEIGNMEKVLADAEAAGLDTSKSRQSLKIARNFMDMGKYQKAMLYCQNAKNSLE